jgi:hypothetical protein
MNVPEQGSLFNPNRYSPVSAAVMFQLPESSARSFLIASALGPWLDLDGSNKKLRSGKEAGGTLIRKRERRVILHALGIGEGRWLQLVRDWEKRYVAQRCSPGVVFLFAKWLEDECPACHTEVLHDGALPPGPDRARGSGFRKGHPYHPPRTSATENGAISSSTRTDALVLPLRASERERDTQQGRGQQGGYRP